MFQTLTGTEYLMCEIACKHDKSFEKRNWNDRLAHFSTLTLIDEDIFKKASNPIGLKAAVLAYLHTQKTDEPTGYMITLDASSSGLQLLSLLVSCPISFRLCGGLKYDCVDSYTAIYADMNLPGSLTRKQVKNAIMTSLYGSISTPEETFGANVDLFYETMERMAPGAWDLNISLQELWNQVPDSTYAWTLPDNFHACIETKIKEQKNFSFLGVDHKLTVETQGRPDFHKGLGPNLIHSIDGMIVREMVRRCAHNSAHIKDIMFAISGKADFILANQFNKEKMTETLWQNYIMSGFLSTRILDYLDSKTLMRVDTMVIAKMIMGLPEDPFHVVTVHDCFRSHPNHGNDLRKQYNTIMADINNSHMLSDMCSQVAGKTLHARKVGVIPYDDILNGNYLLT